jgi:hypothetical protein
MQAKVRPPCATVPTSAKSMASQASSAAATQTAAQMTESSPRIFSSNSWMPVQ